MNLGQEALKGNRFLLLENYKSLQPDRKARLDVLLAASQPLFIANSMKEHSPPCISEVPSNSAPYNAAFQLALLFALRCKSLVSRWALDPRVDFPAIV